MKRVWGILSAVCIALFALVSRNVGAAAAMGAEGNAYLAAVAVEGASQLRHRENLALWYNHTLASGEIPAGVDGKGLLSYGGVVALVELPGTEAQIPVYRETVQAGFSLQEGTALPIGGQRIPAVLEFCGVETMQAPEEGSCFCIHVLDRQLTYRVVGYDRTQIPPGDVCLLVFGDVTAVGVRVYPNAVFPGKN